MNDRFSARDSFASTDTRELKRKRNIVDNLAPRQQSRILKAHSKVPRANWIGTAIAAKKLDATTCGAGESCCDSKQRRLAASTWTDDRGQSPRLQSK